MFEFSEKFVVASNEAQKEKLCTSFERLERHRIGTRNFIQLVLFNFFAGIVCRTTELFY